MYEYANARIRGLYGLLLDPPELHAAAAAPTLAAFALSLSHTDYQADIDAGSGRVSGFELIEDALQTNLSRRIRGLLRFFPSTSQNRPSGPGTLLQVILARGDTNALVAILRGKAAGSPPDDVLAALLPTGALDRARLVALVDLPGIPECLAQLARWHLPLASSLVGLDPHGWARDRSVQPLETALWRGLITWSQAQLRGRDSNTTLVREALALSIDVFNVASLVRLLHRGAGPPARNPEDVFVAGGNVPLNRLAAAIDCTAVEDGLQQLGHTPLTRAIWARSAATAGDLSSDAELALESSVCRWAQRQIFRDPLGIGVALAYHAAKVLEVRRLRLIARALQANWPRYRVGELLEVLSGATAANRL